MRKHLTFRDTGKWRQTNEHWNPILMRCHYFNLGSASDFSKAISPRCPNHRPTKSFTWSYAIYWFLCDVRRICINMQGKAIKQAFPVVWSKIWMGNCNLGSNCIEMLKWLRKRKILKESHFISLVLMFVICEVLQWIQFTFLRQKERKKIDKKIVYDSK